MQEFIKPMTNVIPSSALYVNAITIYNLDKVLLGRFKQIKGFLS